MSYIDYLISIPWGILKQTTTDLKEVEEYNKKVKEYHTNTSKG